MKNIYKREIEVASAIDDKFSKLSYSTSILRSLLQLVTVSAIELSEQQTNTDDIGLDSYIIRLREPSDGLPITILDNIIPHLRSQIHPRICYGWFEKIGQEESNLTRDLQSWIEFRNKYPAHGITDNPTAEIWSDRTILIVERCVRVFEELIPVISSKGKQYLSSGSIDCTINTPLLVDGKAIVITKIHQRKANWKLSVQTLSNLNSVAISLDLPSSTIFSIQDRNFARYDLVSIHKDNSEHYLEHNIPIRQTDFFEGREKEISQLTDWLNDQDSRRCQIYGDGGYGKTTLLLEALNRYLEGRLNIEKLEPLLICFYTAKMTRWNASGLKHISGIPPMMTECIRELFSGLRLPIDKSAYTSTSKQLIGRAETALKEQGLTRDDVLLVVDNTETLSVHQSQTEELADLLRDIGKKLCRVIITSRRQESIEATPILVEGLSIEDSISLLKRLADEHGATPIKQAGESKLRKVSAKLMYKPILLEALVVYIARANISIDAALESLYSYSEEALLEFLYDDAWARLNEHQRDLFLLLFQLQLSLMIFL